MSDRSRSPITFWLKQAGGAWSSDTQRQQLAAAALDRERRLVELGELDVACVLASRQGGLPENANTLKQLATCEQELGYR